MKTTPARFACLIAAVSGNFLIAQPQDPVNVRTPPFDPPPNLPHQLPALAPPHIMPVPLTQMAGVLSAPLPATAGASLHKSREAIDPGDQDDPGYATYKAAYKLILEEKWEDARKKFSEVLSKYAKSKYVDDAEYWIAYSWKYSDQRKAIEAYKKFLKQYPASNYYDDAAGDLNRLENPEAAAIAGSAETFVATRRNLESLARGAEAIGRAAGRISGKFAGSAPRPPSRSTDDPEIRMKMEALQAIVRSGRDEKTFELVKETALDKQQSRELRETAFWLLREFKGKNVTDVYLQIIKEDADKRLKQTAPHFLGQSERNGDDSTANLIKQIALDQKQDREIREAALHSLREMKRGDALDFYLQVAKTDADERIRSTALYYIGEVGKKDPEKVFKIYKEFLLDQQQPRSLRESAMHSVTQSKHDETLNLLLQVARSDPDERIQSTAIYWIGQYGKNKSKSMETLVSLFDSLPSDRPRSLESILYAVASLGTDSAVDFLARVAKTHQNYDLRRNAVYYIGNIGGEKARAALYDILKGK